MLFDNACKKLIPDLFVGVGVHQRVEMPIRSLMLDREQAGRKSRYTEIKLLTTQGPRFPLFFQRAPHPRISMISINPQIPIHSNCVSVSLLSTQCWIHREQQARLGGSLILTDKGHIIPVRLGSGDRAPPHSCPVSAQNTLVMKGLIKPQVGPRFQQDPKLSDSLVWQQ